MVSALRINPQDVPAGDTALYGPSEPVSEEEGAALAG